MKVTDPPESSPSTATITSSTTPPFGARVDASRFATAAPSKRIQVWSGSTSHSSKESRGGTVEFEVPNCDVEELANHRFYEKGHVLKYISEDDLYVALSEQLADALLYCREMRDRGLPVPDWCPEELRDFSS